MAALACLQVRSSLLKVFLQLGQSFATLDVFKINTVDNPYCAIQDNNVNVGPDFCRTFHRMEMC